MQVSRDKSGFPTNRNMIGMGAILHKVYEIKNSVYHIDHPFADPIWESCQKPGSALVSQCCGGFRWLAPSWHPGGTLALWRKTELVLAVPCQCCTILLCVVPVCACVLCVPVCVQGQRTSCGQQHGWLGTIGSLQAGQTRRALAETPVVRDQDWYSRD